MAHPLVTRLVDYPEEERRGVLLHLLAVHGGSPVAVARVFGVTVDAIQQQLRKHGLQGEARRARDRWARMFQLGGNDGAKD